MEIVNNFVLNVRGSFDGISRGILDVLPGIIEGIVLLVVGWIVANILGKVVAKIAEVVRLDDLMATAGVRSFFQKAGIKLRIEAIFEEVVKWFVLIVFFISAAKAFGLPQVVEFLQRVLNYIPNVIIATLIAIAGVLIADFVASLAHGVSRATKTGSSTLVAGIIRYAVIIFTIVVVLDQLQIGDVFLASFFNNLGLAFAAAFALAFGLGGKDVAAEIVKKARKDLQ